MIQSLSMSAKRLALHNLNNEGTEGNQQQTQIVHVIAADGKRHVVNAVSGDMFKHIYVRHLTAILQAQGEPLSVAAATGSPDRITADPEFKKAITGRAAAEVQSEMLARCAVTDIAGTLFTEGITVARKSCAEFGWVVGIPDRVHTEQHFHVRFDVDRRRAASQAPRGEGTIAGPLDRLSPAGEFWGIRANLSPRAFSNRRQRHHSRGGDLAWVASWKTALRCPSAIGHSHQAGRGTVQYAKPTPSGMCWCYYYIEFLFACTDAQSALDWLSLRELASIAEYSQSSYSGQDFGRLF